jgi:hypothetical protein
VLRKRYRVDVRQVQSVGTRSNWTTGSFVGSPDVSIPDEVAVPVMKSTHAALAEQSKAKRRVCIVRVYCISAARERLVAERAAVYCCRCARWDTLLR